MLWVNQLFRLGHFRQLCYKLHFGTYGKIHYKWPFSIAIFVYERVPEGIIVHWRNFGQPVAAGSFSPKTPPKFDLRRGTRSASGESQGAHSVERTFGEESRSKWAKSNGKSRANPNFMLPLYDNGRLIIYQ